MSKASSLPLDVDKGNASSFPTTPAPPHVTPTNQDDPNNSNNNNMCHHRHLLSESASTTGTFTSTSATTSTADVLAEDEAEQLLPEGRDSSCVQVAVRVRPSLPGEAKDCVISVDTERSAVQVYGNGGPRFTFDKVLPPTVSQSFVFDTVVQPLVDKALQGYNATIFAYGQTGSGKTYTILGPAEAWMGTSSSSISSSSSTNASMSSQPQHAPSTGLLPRAVYALFDGLAAQEMTDTTTNKSDKQNGFENYSYTVTLQFLEVYGDEIRDLLGHGMTGQNKLTVREYHDEPEVVGAECITCPTAAHAIKAVAQGSLRRVTAATAMNATSSRSHALLTVGVRQEWRNVDGGGDSDNNGNSIVKQSKFHFCDLAGSERQKRTQAEGQRLKEGIHINQGLLVLGNVISALASQSSHVPYRDSKLTRLLRGSLGGNHQTLMIACVAGNQANVDESLNCLRYANRAKNIRNSAVVNLDANSKRLLELQSHIVRLAQSLDLVLGAVTTASQTYAKTDNAAEKEEIKENVNWSAILAQIPYSRQALQMMVAGGQSQVRDIDKTSAAASSVKTLSPAKSPGMVVASSPSNQSTIQHQSSPTPRTPREDYRLHEMEGRIHALERELVHTQKRLEESQEYHDAAEVELHRYRALERIMTTADPSDPAGASTINESSFLEQATAYEQEISFLRKELQAAERKANRFAIWQNANPQQEEQRFQAAEALLQQDRIRLRQLQSTVSAAESSSDQTMLHTTAGTAPADLLEEEVQAEQADLEKMTKKYLAQGGHVDEDDHAEEREETVGAVAPPIDNNDSATTTTSMSTRMGMPIEIKHLHMENDLLALGKSIEEREKLIQELKENQQKFASMREFYEEKLSKMEAELLEKEHEREQLAKQLETAKTRGSTQDIQNRLREKDLYIDSLRRKQKELRNLTNVSHRNELDIARLQKDVTEMKRKRVDMQKQLAAERKQHAVEVKELQKTATQKEREIHKLQKITNQREMQAQKAGQVAKARLEELNALRAKNREVEKKLRMQTVKRGMMQKAGIDSVLVGQRAGRQNKTQFSKSMNKPSKVDVDQLQSLFDKKISDVVQREALAHKLAEEWEQHYDLTEKKQELLEADSQETEEDLQALSIKIRFKQNRIRQLAKQLSKESQTGGRKSDGDYDLFDEHFRRLCKDSPPEEAQETLARVLFGMVVKERRRISALARTASSLDEKLQEAEQAAEEKEMQLRSYMDEHEYLAAELSHTQQKNILSLMEMVKVDRLQGNATNGVDERSHSDETKLLVLANERIAVLENQIEQLQSQYNRAAENSLKSSDGFADMKKSLHEARLQRDEREQTLETTFDTLQKVRERLLSVFLSVDANGDRENLETALDLVNLMISQTNRNGQELQQKDSFAIGIAPYVHVQEEYEETPDDPDWAAELIEDLEFIAEGKIPPSLQDLPGFAEQVASFDNMTSESNTGSVWDRLTNPDNFTGTQKRKKKHLKTKKPQLHIHRTASSPASEISPRIMTSGEVPASDLPSTPVNPSQVVDDAPGPATERKTYKSVFDRLISPSQATGTQRQRLARKNESGDFAGHGNEEGDVDRLLDDALGDSRKSETLRHTERLRDEEESHAALSPMGKDKRSVGGHYTDYAEQDVFERLQRTSTVSSQNRLGSNVSEIGSTDSIKTLPQANHQKGGQVHVTASTDSVEVHSQTNHSNQHYHDDTYTSLDVFERLQKTTTEAYAKKVNKPRD